MRKIPFLRILIAFIIGIFLNQFWNGHLNFKFGILSICSFLAFISYIISKKHLKAILPFGILLISAFISLGTVSKEISSLKYNKAHYSKYVNHSESVQLILKVNSKKIGKWNSTYEVDVLQVNTLDSLSLNVVGKLQLVTRNQSLEIDDIIDCKGLLQDINPTFNRFTFDYKKFLKENMLFIN